MYFQQFYLACLSHASYMIGSGGIAAVVDPQRDVGIYLEEAQKHDLSIEHVIETHLHAVQKAVLKPLNRFTDMLDGLDTARPAAVHCKSGYRSSIAASLLARAGIQHVMNVVGGFDAWRACSLPFVRADRGSEPGTHFLAHTQEGGTR